MKVGLYSDIHFGIYQDDDVILNYQMEQLDNIHKFYLKNNINEVIILGDVFDNRKLLNVKTIDKVVNFFNAQKINIKILLGNHDYFNKFDNKYSSTRTLLEECKNIEIIEGIHKYENITLCSWIFQNEVFEYNLKNISSDYLLGHFDIKGFYYIKNVISKTGFDKDIFKKFKMVISGHYHYSSNDKNITYTGTPYQIDWNDYNVKKYYYILDTDNNKLEKYENTNDLFFIIKSEDTINYEKVTNKIVKFIIENTNDYTDIIDKIKENNPFKLTIEDKMDIINQAQENINTDSNLLDVTKEYVEKNINGDTINKNILMETFIKIYNEEKNI